MRPLAVLAVCLALALDACGGDDGAAPTGSATASATVAPAPSPTPSPTPGTFSEQLSYIGPDGEIRLVNPDGSANHILSNTPCDAGDRVREFSMAWAPDGSALGYICASDLAARQTLLFLDSDGNRTMHVEGVSGFRWSPDSTRVAYETSAEDSDFVVGLVALGTGETETLNDHAFLMEWVGPNSLLLGLDPAAGDLTTNFKAHLIDLASGVSTALPEFDNAGALWVSPNGAKIINSSMAVYDFATTLTTLIEGGHIGYPSEFIPHGQLAFSPDGATIHWANAADFPTSIWEARVDAPKATKLGEISSPFIGVSPFGRVAASMPIPDAAVGTVVMEGLATDEAQIEVGFGHPPFAWRSVLP